MKRHTKLDLAWRFILTFILFQKYLDLLKKRIDLTILLNLKTDLKTKKPQNLLNCVHNLC